MGKWKAVQNHLNKKGPSAPVELYDLEVDEGERNDLADRSPEIVSRALAIFKEAHAPSPIWKFSWEQKK